MVIRYAKDDANVMLVGNKTDLEQKAVSTEQGEELANNKNYPFIETSAKTGAVSSPTVLSYHRCPLCL